MATGYQAQAFLRIDGRVIPLAAFDPFIVRQIELFERERIEDGRQRILANLEQVPNWVTTPQLFPMDTWGCIREVRTPGERVDWLQEGF